MNKSPSKDELKKRLAELEKDVKKSAGSLDNEIASISHTLAKKTNRKNNNEDSMTENDSDIDKSLDIVLSDGQDSSSCESNVSRAENSSKFDVTDTDKENHSLASTSSTKSDTNNVIIEGITDEYNDPDLYGKDWCGEEMCKLMDKIYCKETVYKTCTRQCTQASHVVRRLIAGVLKPSGYIDDMLTEQASRAHPQKGGSTPVKPLNNAAKNEIISKK